MNRLKCSVTACLATMLVVGHVWAGQAPLSDTAPDVAISHRDRVYAAEQFSNTVSVVDPAANALLGVIRLGRAFTDKLQSSLSRTGTGSRIGLLARSPHARRCLHWIELGDVYRHCDERRESTRLTSDDLRRGFLHSGRLGGLDHHPGRELYSGLGCRDFRRKDPHRRADRPRYAKSSRRTASMVTSVLHLRRRPSSFQWRSTG